MFRLMGQGQVSSTMEPHPSCVLCTSVQICPFHAAKDPVELGRAFAQAVRERGSVALIDLMTWAMTYAEAMVPQAAMSLVRTLDVDAMEEEFAEVMDLEGFDGADLRRLAATAMALAMMHNESEETENAPKQPPKVGHRR